MKQVYHYYLYPAALFKPIDSIDDLDNAIEEAYPEWVYPDISKETRKMMFFNILIKLRQDRLTWKEEVPREIPKDEYLTMDALWDGYVIKKWTRHYGKKVMMPDNGFYALRPIDHFTKIVQERVDILNESSSKRRKKK